MLDQCYVISYGGAVLFHKAFVPASRRTTVDTLIKEYLLEDRVGEKECIIDDFKVRWVMQNQPDFMVIAMYPRTRQLTHVDDLLIKVRDAFRQQHGAVVDVPSRLHTIRFGATFDAIHADFEAAEKRDARVGLAVPRESTQTGNEEEVDSEEDLPPASGGKPAASPKAPQGSMVTKDGRSLAKRGAKLPSGAVAASPPAAAATGKKKQKVGTKWDKPSDDPNVDASTGSSSNLPTAEEIAIQTALTRKTFIKTASDGSVVPVQEKVWENQSRGRLATWLRTYVGSRELDTQDFAGVIPNLREKLIGKNVAVEVAENVCSSVQTSLTGKKLGTFESLHGAIEEAMVCALRRILQPKVEVNILRAVAAAVDRKRPYSIVLCGVNGVGKSTSLSKIAYWLQQNGHSLLIAAGDTFRHGAVEQLEVHGRCLGVPIFQMGYGTDPSAVAAAALAQASRQKTDVVLIDTAGRMQDHESRMRALAKLIHDNQPDLVLFVGEALVGNNGVDQLRKFNQCLFDFTPVGLKPRGIDGIVLTKFDTIDDKVGAALSMVYELGQPIVFVGVGQTYQDLKVIDADVVVSALMQ